MFMFFPFARWLASANCCGTSSESNQRHSNHSLPTFANADRTLSSHTSCVTAATRQESQKMCSGLAAFASSSDEIDWSAQTCYTSLSKLDSILYFSGCLNATVSNEYHNIPRSFAAHPVVSDADSLNNHGNIFLFEYVLFAVICIGLWKLFLWKFGFVNISASQPPTAGRSDGFQTNEASFLIVGSALKASGPRTLYGRELITE